MGGMRLGMRSAVAMGLVASVWLAVQRGPQAQEAGEPRTTSGSPAAAMSEKARRAEMLRLRTRIAKAKNTNAAFWRDTTRLEQLGPKEWRIAVVQHPGARMVYTYRKVGDLAVADDHLGLGPYELVVAQQAALRGQDAGSVAFATIPQDRSQWWPSGIVPFEIDPALENRARNAILDAIALYEEKTPLRFRARDGEQTFVRYVKQLECCGPLGHLSSMTDHVGRRSGENTVKIQTRDAEGALLARELIGRSALHETGHIVGMFHEHNRKDRDDFVRVDLDCADFFYRLAGNFEIEQESESIGPYDFDSIMHYGSRRGKKGPFWDEVDCFDMVKRREHRAPGDETGELFPNFTLSRHDINGLHHVYGRNGDIGAAGDSYGAALLAHDLDGDRLADLAVGAPGRAQGSGAVYLYKGTATGHVLWKVLTPSTTQPGQRFGTSLAAGDFDGNGIQDLAVGAPLARVAGKDGAGKVFLFQIRGNREREQLEVLTRPAGTVETMDRFGFALAAGRFFDPDLDHEPAPRLQLAVGAPGARDGDRGRIGQVWVMNKDIAEPFRPVRIASSAAAKWGQLGFAMTTIAARDGGNDKLVVAAPGVTFGGCGQPVVYTTRVALNDLETVRILSEPNAAPAPFCPQDPNLSDAIDAFPNPVWDASFGAHLASGDFDGDGIADLAIAGAPRVYLFRGQAAGGFVHAKTVARTNFGEAGSEFSFGTALAVADLDGDSRDELMVGAPQAPLEGMQGVGQVYVYRGCTPIALPASGVGGGMGKLRPPANLAELLRRCQGGLRTWFRLHQEHAQEPPATGGIGGGIGGIVIPPPSLQVADNASGDRFGYALAVVGIRDERQPMIYVGGVDKALRGGPRAGAAFLAVPAFTGGEPPFRTTAGLNQAFTTRFNRD